MSDFDDDLPRRRSGGLFRRRGRRAEPALLEPADDYDSEVTELGASWNDFAPDTWARDVDDEPVEQGSRRRGGRRRGRTADMFTESDGRGWNSAAGRQRPPASSEVDAWLQSDAEQFADSRRTSAERWVDPEYIDDVTGPITGPTNLADAPTRSPGRRRTISSHVTVTPAYEAAEQQAEPEDRQEGAEDWPDVQDGHDNSALHDDEPTSFGDSLEFGDPLDAGAARDPGVRASGSARTSSPPGSTWPDDEDPPGAPSGDVATSPEDSPVEAGDSGEPRRAAILRDAPGTPPTAPFEPPPVAELLDPVRADTASDDPWAEYGERSEGVRIVGPSAEANDPQPIEGRVLDARVRNPNEYTTDDVPDADASGANELSEHELSEHELSEHELSEHELSEHQFADDNLGGSEDGDSDEWDAPAATSRKRRGWRERKRGRQAGANDDEDLWPDPDAPVESDTAWDAPDLTATVPAADDESWGDDEPTAAVPGGGPRSRGDVGTEPGVENESSGDYSAEGYDEYGEEGYADGDYESEGEYDPYGGTLVGAGATGARWSAVAAAGGVLLALVAAAAQLLTVGYGISRPEGSGDLRQDLLQRLGTAFDNVGSFPAMVFLLAAIVVSLPLVSTTADQRRYEGKAGTTLGLCLLGSIVAVGGSYLAFRSDLNAVDQLGGGLPGWQLMRSGANLALAAGVALVGFLVSLLSLRHRSADAG